MITTPSSQTLARYGLSVTRWKRLLTAQGGKCGVCGQLPKPSKDGLLRLQIDHEHVKGWKRMPPEKRVLYVRGLLCQRCNWRFLPIGLTLALAEGITRYLGKYEARRPQ